ncbi:ABC transporter permease [Merdimonas faecis]|uniref:ABC transporter permease n=1 Tax=Merdimonas faecis TaxID=1653435 RepID=UPI00320B50E3
MKSFLLKRFGQMLLVLVIVSIFAFSITYFAPGDPLYMYTSPSVSSYKMTDEQLDQMRESLGLNGNIVERYISWASKILQGDWGLSISNHQSVLSQVLDRLPNTMGLMGAALLLAILVSVPLGLMAGYFKNKWVDNLISGFSYLAISLPAFWFGIMLIILFSLKLGWLPSSGMRTIGVNSAGDVIQHAILPVIVLSVNNTAVFLRYIRSNTIVQMEEDYVLTAISKGASKWHVLCRHIMKNCLLPIITMVGMNFGTLITGSFIVESVFGWPGLGTLCMDAINNRDYTMIMGITMFSCVMLLIGNFLADILYGVADPRIKQGKEKSHG